MEDTAFDPQIGGSSVSEGSGKSERSGIAIVPVGVYAVVVWDAAVAVNYAGLVNIGAVVNAFNWVNVESADASSVA